MEINSKSCLKEIRHAAWNSLKGNWVKSIISMILLYIFYFLIFIFPMTFFLLSISVGLVSNIPHTSSSIHDFFLLTLIVLGPFLLAYYIVFKVVILINYGFHRLIFNIAFQHNEAKFSDIVYGFKNRKACKLFNKSKRSFKKIISSEVESCCLLIMSIFITVGISSNDLTLQLFALLLIVVLSTYYLYNSQFTGCYYIYFSNESMLTDDAIYYNEDIFKYTYKKKAFYKLHLKLLVWYLLSIASLGIGLLFLIPYVKVVQATFFKKLIHKNI